MAGEGKELSSIVYYGINLLYAGVCVEEGVSIEEVERKVNMEHPTGISSRWSVDDEPFADGTPNPCPCQDHPGRIHRLLSC